MTQPSFTQRIGTSHFAKQGAFTLIELIVALSVVILISGLGLTSINSAFRSIQFQGAVRSVAECLQRSQSDAAAPTTGLNFPVAHTDVLLTNSGADLVCTHTVYKAGSVRDNSTSLDGSSHTVTSIRLCKVHVDGQGSDAQNPATATEAFSVLEHGLPEALATTGATNDYALAPSLGTGLGVQYSLVEIVSASDTCNALPASNLQATLKVNRLGTPVSFTIINGS